MVAIDVTPEQRTAAERAACLIDREAQGLEETGSKDTSAGLHQYAGTLKRIAQAGDRVDLTSDEKEHVEQATFVLMGLHAGLAGADFEKRAAVIEADVRCLNKLITAYNTVATRHP
jgi:hypothetical protein